MTDIYKCEECGGVFDGFEMNYKAAQEDKKTLCRNCRAKKGKQCEATEEQNDNRQ